MEVGPGQFLQDLRGQQTLAIAQGRAPFDIINSEYLKMGKISTRIFQKCPVYLNLEFDIVNLAYNSNI